MGFWDFLKNNDSEDDDVPTITEIGDSFRETLSLLKRAEASGNMPNVRLLARSIQTLAISIGDGTLCHLAEAVEEDARHSAVSKANLKKLEDHIKSKFLHLK